MPRGIYIRTEQAKIAIRLARARQFGINNPFFGRHHSEESKKKMSDSKCGCVPYNKGNHLNDIYDEKRAAEIRKNMCSAQKGHGCSDATRQKMSLVNTGVNNPFYGKKHSQEFLEKMSFERSGKKSRFWKGGISFEPYGYEFNRNLKEQIRKRDNYRCQECMRHQNELFHNTVAGMRSCKLSVHHIDFNKKNNNLNNLISLCQPCHSQTQFGREDWTEHFNEILKNSGGNENG